MNREETKKAIEVMQAYVDGAKIEYLPCSGVWQDSAPSPAWAWNAVSYRVKPAKPRTGRIIIYFHESYEAVQLTTEVKEALETAGISYVDK